MEKYTAFIETVCAPDVNWRRAEVQSNNCVLAYLVQSARDGTLSIAKSQELAHTYRCFQAGKGELRAQPLEHLEAQIANDPDDLLSRVLLAMQGRKAD